PEQVDPEPAIVPRVAGHNAVQVRLAQLRQHLLEVGAKPLKPAGEEVDDGPARQARQDVGGPARQEAEEKARQLEAAQPAEVVPAHRQSSMRLSLKARPPPPPGNRPRDRRRAPTSARTGTTAPEPR